MTAIEYQSPYVGLAPYGESDAPLFFGRERDVRLITANFHASSLTLLYGESGVGKSSVLRAGVLHRLRARRDLLAVPFNSWRGDPVDGLKSAVASAVADAGYAPPPASESDSLASFLVTCTRLIERRLMIILDQFEEFFLYHPSPSMFDSEFPAAVTQTDAPVNFLISLREEVYARLDRFEGLIPNLYDNGLRLEHLDREAARRAIVGPLERNMISIEPELVSAVLEQLKVGRVVLGEPKRGFVMDNAPRSHVEAPFLQMVMTRLWTEEVRAGSRVLRRDTLDKLGGAERIVITHLDEVMAELSAEEQDMAASILRYLVTPSGTKISFGADDLSDFTGVPEAKLKTTLAYLTNPSVRVLRAATSEASGGADLQYEIAHDVLGPAVLDWRVRYSRERETAALLQEARRTLEKERRKARRWAVYLISTTFVSVLLLLLFFYVYRQRNAAMMLRAEAEQQRAETQKLLEIVKKLDRVIPYFKSIMRGHNGAVNDAVFSPDARKVLTASSDGTARVWETETGQTLFVLQGHSGALSDAAFSPDGKLIGTAGNDGTARLWDAGSGTSIAELKGHADVVNGVVFSPDARYMVTSSADGTARVWDAVGRPVVVLIGHTGSVNQVAVSPDSRLLATASNDGTARLWDAMSGKLLVNMKGHQNAVYSVAFSPSGKRVLTASADRTARIWDYETGLMIVELKGHTDAVLDAAFSPDERLVVTASLDRTAMVWNVATGHNALKLSGHTAEVLRASFSPDGLRVITASADSTARVWETTSGRELAELRGHIGGVKGAIFSPTGDLVVTASEDNTARVWDVVEAGGFRIKEVFLKAVPEFYNGLCPVTISLIGGISVEGTKGQVRYRFVRSNGSASPESVLNFDSSGIKEVSWLWKFGSPLSSELSGSFYLETLSPQKVRSAEASYRVRCENLK